MLRLSKLTDYATVILTHMAKTAHQQHAAMELTEFTGISLPTVSKILKILVKANIVNSTRGAKGGYILARSPGKITVAEVIAALEGPIALTECSITHHDCEQATCCEIKGNWGLINQAISNTLNAITLADMVMPKEQMPQPIEIPVTSLYR
jgi:FeS assembly SUF system regulator